LLLKSGMRRVTFLLMSKAAVVGSARVFFLARLVLGSQGSSRVLRLFTD